MIPKFRAWHKLEKRMFPVTTLHFNDNGPIVVGLFEGIDSWGTPLESVELMQWTGRDVMRHDLYEGDLVESPYDCLNNSNKSIYTIEWQNDSWQARSIEDDCCYYLDDIINCDDVKILGNIYQNAELLKD